MFTGRWSSKHSDFRGKGFSSPCPRGPCGQVLQGTPPPAMAGGISHMPGTSPPQGLCTCCFPCQRLPESHSPSPLWSPSTPAPLALVTVCNHIPAVCSLAASEEHQLRLGWVALLSGLSLRHSLCLAHISCSLNMGPLREQARPSQPGCPSWGGHGAQMLLSRGGTPPLRLLGRRGPAPPHSKRFPWGGGGGGVWGMGAPIPAMATRSGPWGLPARPAGTLTQPLSCSSWHPTGTMLRGPHTSPKCHPSTTGPHLPTVSE